MDKAVFLKLLTVILVFLLAFTYCIFPARADSTIPVQFRPTFVGATVTIYSTNGNTRVVNLDSSDIVDVVYNEAYDLDDGKRHYFSGFYIERNRIYNYSGDVAYCELNCQFYLGSDLSKISHNVTSCQMICGVVIDGYQSSYNYGVNYLNLTGKSGDSASGTYQYMGWHAFGEFYNFYTFSTSSGSTLTGEYFTDANVTFRWTGNPASTFIEILFDNSNYITLSDYSPDIDGISDGINDLNNQVGRTNHLIEQSLSPEESSLLDQQKDTGNQVRQEAESMAEALDQFQAPTDEISEVNNSISSALTDNQDAVDLLSLDFSDSSEFFNTVTIIGIPGLGICFLGYVLYGKKD